VALYTITVDPPADKGVAHVTVFYEEDAEVELQPGKIEHHELDLSPFLEKIQELVRHEPANMTATIAFTSALGSNAGEESFLNTPLGNPLVILNLGVTDRGDPFSYVNIWITDDAGWTYRARYRTLLRLDCVNGAMGVETDLCLFEQQLGGDDCSEEAINLGLAIGLPVVFFLVLAVVLFLFYEQKIEGRTNISRYSSCSYWTRDVWCCAVSW